MSTYEPEKLWTLWQQEQIDSPMAMGHLLQNLVKHQKALEETNSSLTRLRREFDHLSEQIKVQAQGKRDKNA